MSFIRATIHSIHVDFFRLEISAMQHTPEVSRWIRERPGPTVISEICTATVCNSQEPPNKSNKKKVFEGDTVTWKS